jgi:hypothetical protein
VKTEQRKQFEAFLAGEKDLCVVELRKDPATFDTMVCHRRRSASYCTFIHELPEGREVVVAKDYRTIVEYLEILHSTQWDTARARLQYRLGRLFGYDADSCHEFSASWTPEYCQCSKCVGVDNCNPEVM